MTGSIASVTASDGLVLVLNSGSSTVKFALLHPETGERVLGGLADKVGTPEAVLSIRRYPGDATEEQLPDGSYQAAITRILDLADTHSGAKGQAQQVIGAGHRVVHGRDRFSASVLVDDEVIDAIRAF